MYSHTLTPCACTAQESRSSLFVSGTKTVTPRRAMSYLTPHWTTPSTCTPSLFSTTFLVLVTVFFCRASTSQRVSLLRSTTASEWRFGGAPSTGYEPKPPDELDHKHLTADKQIAEHEDLRVKPQFFHRPSIASTFDSAESMATPPPDSHLKDEQIRALLTSPLYLQEREANAERSQVYRSAREKNDVQFISRSDKYRETFRIVFEQK